MYPSIRNGCEATYPSVLIPGPSELGKGKFMFTTGRGDRNLQRRVTRHERIGSSNDQDALARQANAPMNRARL